MVSQELDHYSDWIVVISTDNYTGNFERELCAYSTGIIGSCGVGEELAQKFYEEMELVDFKDWNGVDVETCGEDFNNPFFLIIQQKADDNGHRRPCAMWQMANTRMAIYFKERPSEELLELLMSRAKKYAEKNDIKIIGHVLVETEIHQKIVK